jgi:predicted protein tyrosine phosphatase
MYRALPWIANLADAERIARDFDSVISLAGPAKGRGALKNHQHRLFCPFDDVLEDSEDEGVAAGAEQIREILGFTSDAGLILVHCEYGQSRSTAVALGIAVALGTDPENAGAELLKAHPNGRPFVPNEWVLSLFDNHLACNGRLVTAGLNHTRF